MFVSLILTPEDQLFKDLMAMGPMSSFRIASLYVSQKTSNRAEQIILTGEETHLASFFDMIPDQLGATTSVPRSRWTRHKDKYLDLLRVKRATLFEAVTGRREELF